MTLSELLFKLKGFRNKIRTSLPTPLKAAKNNENANTVEDARVHLIELNANVVATKTTSSIVAALNTLKAKVLSVLPDPTRNRGKSKDVDFIDTVVENIYLLTTTTSTTTTTSVTTTTTTPTTTTTTSSTTTTTPA